MTVLGNILLLAGLGFTFVGSLCILMFSNFYSRLLACSYIDTIGMFFILAGILCKYYHETQPLKIILLLLIVMIINPVSTYAIGRCAYLRGERPKEEEDHD